MRLIKGAGRPSGRSGKEMRPLCPRFSPPPAILCPNDEPNPTCPFSLADGGIWGPASKKLKSRSRMRSCSTLSLAELSNAIMEGSAVRSASERSWFLALAWRWEFCSRLLGVLVRPGPGWGEPSSRFRISSFSRVKRRSIAARQSESFISFFLFFFSGRWGLRPTTLWANISSKMDKTNPCHLQVYTLWKVNHKQLSNGTILRKVTIQAAWFIQVSVLRIILTLVWLLCSSWVFSPLHWLHLSSSIFLSMVPLHLSSTIKKHQIKTNVIFCPYHVATNP